MKFNGIKKPYLRVHYDLIMPAFAPIKREIIQVPGKPGGYLTDTETEVLTLTVPVTIEPLESGEFSNLERVKEDLAAWLITEEEKELIFDHEPNRIYHAVVEQSFDTERAFIKEKGTLIFICPNPYRNGIEQSTIGNPAIINNEGTAESFPIIEIEISQNTTYISVSDGENMNIIGDLLSVDQTPYEPQTIILNDPMTTTVGWGPAGFTPDGSIDTGNISTDGQSLIPVDYGAGTSWHGPALQKSLSEQLQDFSVEFTFAFSADTIQELGKIQLYGLDAANKRIFMLGMADYWRDAERNMPEGYLYNDLEQRYPVLVRNAGEDWNKFYGYIKISRVGQRIDFVIKKVNIETNEEITVKQKRYYDTSNTYQRKLAGVGIHFAKFGDYTPVSSIGAGHITVWRINQEDGVPYIALAGDKVVFDHTIDLITINGEEALKNKLFAGEYFAIKSGQSQIKAEPTEAIGNVRVVWTPKWL